jgi:hypothetical protein
MRAIVLGLIVGVAGCGMRPVADTMDYFFPAEMVKPGTPTHGGVGSLPPVEPPADAPPIPPPGGDPPVPAIPPPPRTGPGVSPS